MSAAAGNPKRRDHDIRKLLRSKHEVNMGDDTRDFYVKFRGPEDSPYSGGIWKVHVVLPAQYPYKSPSIGFCNPIFHPNVDEASGSVCLDVINQTWSPMYELVHIFETFLPQLLLYPNPSDPLNGEAAALLNRDPAAYAKRVKDHVLKHASADIKIDESSSSSSSHITPVSSNNEEGKSVDRDRSNSNVHGGAAMSNAISSQTQDRTSNDCNATTRQMNDGSYGSTKSQSGGGFETNGYSNGCQNGFPNGHANGFVRNGDSMNGTNHTSHSSTTNGTNETMGTDEDHFSDADNVHVPDDAEGMEL